MFVYRPVEPDLLYTFYFQNRPVEPDLLSTFITVRWNRTYEEFIMTPQSLQQKSCVPCEGGVPLIGRDAATEYLTALPDWSIDDDSKTIFRKINCGNFVKAIKLMQRVAEIAEQEQHHPDLHLTGYRHVRIDLTTHAIGGLSENDFILAAKIDRVIA